jgi:hypothetical protein
LCKKPKDFDFEENKLQNIADVSGVFTLKRLRNSDACAYKEII